MGYGERGGLPIEWVRYLVLEGEIYQNLSKKKSGRSAIEPQKTTNTQNNQHKKNPQTIQHNHRDKNLSTHLPDPPPLSKKDTPKDKDALIIGLPASHP